MRRIQLIAAAAALASTNPLLAQGRGRNVNGVPPGQRPPAGMCRIWVDGVPPGKQPAPTDCATAVATRPANARVIFGDDTPFPGRGKGAAPDSVCLARRTTTVLGIPVPLPRDSATIARCRAENARGSVRGGRGGKDDPRARPG